MPKTHEQLRDEWLAIRAEYEAAIEVYGWDDPRTIELEEREAIASDLYLMSHGVR